MAKQKVEKELDHPLAVEGNHCKLEHAFSACMVRICSKAGSKIEIVTMIIEEGGAI